MSAPLLPSPLDYIGRRAFAFYPVIREAAPNSWLLGASSWSEVQVVNAETGRQLWVPRRYIGAVGDQHGSLVVGLTEPVELRDDKLVPRSSRRVIEMPLPPGQPSRRRHDAPAAVVGIRLERTTLAAFQNRHFRVGVFVLFVTGLLALVASASR
jgi:hypothetical protein